MSSDQNTPDDRPEAPDIPDARLYVSAPEGWEARLKQGWEKEYCYAQNPGEDYFHLLMSGEIYLQRGNEKYCLTCALRRGILTTNRLNWKRGPAERE
jgi:hypothetical protein